MQTFNPRPTEPSSGDFPYFRRLWNTIVLSLIGAAFIPLIVIGAGMYHYAASALRENALHALSMEVRHHQKTVDRFLAERTGDLKRIAAIADHPSSPGTTALESALASLPASETEFISLWVTDGQGKKLGQVGSQPPQGEIIAQTHAMEALMTQQVHIGDVFYASDARPQFTLSVRHGEGERILTWHATVPTDYFDHLPCDLSGYEGGVSFLVDKRGLILTSRPGTAEWTKPSGVEVPERHDGVRITQENGRMRAVAWLQNAAWASVVEVEENTLFKQIRQVRNVGIVVFLMGGMLIVFTALLTTNHLVTRLEAKRSKILLMSHHLRRANQMALSLLLHRGYLEEINEAMANIDSTAVLIGEEAARPAGAGTIRNELYKSLGQIRSEVVRSRKTVDQLIDLTRPVVPAVTDIDVNQALSRLIDLFHREILFRNVRVHKDFQEPPPVIRGVPSQLEQVIQNLIFNALEATDKGGEITLTTRMEADFLYITVADNGTGMSKDAIDKLFDPPFTTRPGRLGLGLAISREILLKIGGDLEIDSEPGRGAVFTVSFPTRFKS
jgi:two-component system, NtrC family, sensor kinase